MSKTLSAGFAAVLLCTVLLCMATLVACGKTNDVSSVADLSMSCDNADSSSIIKAKEITPGEYIRNVGGAYFTTLQIYDDGLLHIGPGFSASSQSFFYRYKREGDYIIAGKLRFLIIDKDTLKFIRSDNPDKIEEWIPDGCLYIKNN